MKNYNFRSKLSLKSLCLCRSTFSFAIFLIFGQATTAKPEDSNGIDSSGMKGRVVRVFKPGIFDYKGEEFLVRMRVWGVTYPERGQPGYEEAIIFTEEKLLDQNLTIDVHKEFDLQNLKVVQVLTDFGKENFSRLSIEKGIGWHNEEETNRHGSFVIAQLKAKRQGLGVWKHGETFPAISSGQSIPTPLLRSMIGQNPYSSSINYWVSSFDKIHRPDCSFYGKGRGEYNRRPTGKDCRICGGTNPKGLR